ncbi:hypothetical protein K440DRAFT_629762 [Wilcoxina mikolae CBS 423.85]|nr:hypothetical protein K440DRAFT_629762 [Wilcoxina mikolae CBS 423.85]
MQPARTVKVTSSTRLYCTVAEYQIVRDQKFFLHRKPTFHAYSGPDLPATPRFVSCPSSPSPLPSIRYSAPPSAMEKDQRRPTNRSGTDNTVSRGRPGGTAKPQRSRPASPRFLQRISAVFRGSRPASPASAPTEPYDNGTATDATDSNLSSNPRTIRLSLIPTSVDEDRLRQYLAGLKYETEVLDDNILAFSLVPYRKWLVATVTFRQEPLDLTECRSDRKLHVRLPPELSGATITVDCDFYGITPLYHPPQSEPQYDVIAVCGLSAHAFGSWKSPSQSYVMWLRDILPLDFPDFRVLAWGYESDLKDPTASRNITSFSRQLLMAILGARELTTAKHRPIIFVGHSLGGLIIKQALVDAAEGNSPNDKAILDSCIGILLFGVPNRGLNNENMLSLVKGMKSAPFVHDLMEGSELLRRLDFSFERTYEEHLKSSPVVSFYEMKDTNTVQETPGGGWARTGKPIRMVSQDSATCFIRAMESHHHIPIFTDHSRLVKFSSRDDQNYLAVYSEINEILSTSTVSPLLLSAIDRVQSDDFMQILAEHDQETYKSQIPALDSDNPEYYWITRNIDFTEWLDADGSQTLWILGPPRKEIRRISLYVADAKRNASGTARSVLYFFCSAVTVDLTVASKKPKKPIWTICVQALLYQILLGLPHQEQNQAIAVFLHKTIEALIARQSAKTIQSWKLKDCEFPNGTIRRMLDVSSDKELWGALITVLETVRGPQRIITIDGLDQIQKRVINIDGLDPIQDQKRAFVEGFRDFINRSKVKALLTSGTQDEMGVLLRGVPCIAYDVERQECLSMLRFDNTRYDKITSEHKGSLKWLWSHKEYRKWSVAGNSRLLYIQGKPGSGKSTLTRYFKDHLLEHEPAARLAIIASFFYSFREGESQISHYNMLRSILYDILNQDESFFYHFQRENREYQTLLRGRPDVNHELHYKSLQRILGSIGSHQTEKQLYLVIDAVDESRDTDREHILSLLFDLCSKSSCTVKVFVASRPVVELEHLISTIGAQSMIRMQDVNRSDIQNFVHSFLAKDTSFPDDISSEVSSYILEHSCGVFLWVHLVRGQLIRHYRNGWSRSEIFNFLEGLPKDLEDMYKHILGELEDRKIGKQIFEWVLFARRPPTVLELQHALAIQNSLDTSAESFKNNIINGIERRIINCGGNLLECKGHEEPVVQVMHQTVREFFLRVDGPAANSALRVSEHDAHVRIATSCLRYLMLCIANTPLQKDPSSLESWNPEYLELYVRHLEKWPLINYALSHLNQHMPKNAEAENIAQLVSRLCEQLTDSSASYLFESWISSHLNQNLTAQKKRLPVKDIKNNLLHAATKMQCSHAVEALLLVDAEIEARSQDKTPLMVSAEVGDVTTAQVLLVRKAHLEAKDESNRTALHLAAANGHNSMVKLLVNRGTEMEAKDNNGNTALLVAAHNGHDTTVQLLVQTLGADKQVTEREGRTALHVAAHNGHDTTGGQRCTLRLSMATIP